MAEKRVIEFTLAAPVDGEFMWVHLSIEGRFIGSWDPEHGLVVNETVSEDDRDMALLALGHEADAVAHVVEGVNLLRGALWRRRLGGAGERVERNPFILQRPAAA